MLVSYSVKDIYRLQRMRNALARVRSGILTGLPSMNQDYTDKIDFQLSWQQFTVVSDVFAS